MNTVFPEEDSETPQEGTPQGGEEEESVLTSFLRGTRRLLNRPFFGDDSSNESASTRGRASAKGASSSPPRIASIEKEKLLSQDLMNAFNKSEMTDVVVMEADTGAQLTKAHALMLYRALDTTKKMNHVAADGAAAYELLLKCRNNESQMVEVIKSLYATQLFQNTAKTLSSSAYKPSNASKKQQVDVKPVKHEQAHELASFMHTCVSFLLHVANWRSWANCNVTDMRSPQLKEAANAIQKHIDSVSVPFWDVQISIPLVTPEDPLATNNSPHVSVPAHRFVLTARSEFFAKALSIDLPLKEAREGVVRMDSDLELFAGLLHHLYTGSTDFLLHIARAEKSGLLLTASKYGVEDLAEYIVEHMKANVSDDNATDALHTSLALPKKHGYGLRMKAMEFLTKRNDIDQFDPEFWESLPGSIKEEIKALNKARTHNPLGEATLGCIREFVGMLKEARLDQREKVESLRNRVREDERSLQEFEERTNRQKQRVDAQIANGALAGRNKQQALQLLEGEFHELESRKKWLSHQQGILQKREKFLDKLEKYTEDQMQQMEAFKKISQEHS